MISQFRGEVVQNIGDLILAHAIFLRHVVRRYFRQYEPLQYRARRARRLRRKRFWAAGVNDICAVDQHDKWNRFGLKLHVGLDPYTRRVHWLRVWHSNRDPKLILSYYIAHVREDGGKS